MDSRNLCEFVFEKPNVCEHVFEPHERQMKNNQEIHALLIVQAFRRDIIYIYIYIYNIYIYIYIYIHICNRIYTLLVYT